MKKSAVSALAICTEKCDNRRNKRGVSMKKSLISTVAACALSAYGADFTFVPTAADADWTVASNYRDVNGQPAVSVPGASDVVTIPAASYEIDCSTAAGLANFNAISGFRRIFPTMGAKLVVTVPQDQSPLTLGCAVTASDGKTHAKNEYCEIVKKGSGELRLSSAGKYMISDAVVDYFSDFTVAEGVLKLSQGTVTGPATVGRVRYGNLSISNNATLFTPNGTRFLCQTLRGEGTVTNDCTGTTYSHFVEAPEPSVFAGRLTGRTGSWWINGHLVLTGTNSTLLASMEPQGNNSTFTTGHQGYFSCVKLGYDDKEPSSIGMMKVITLFAGAGFELVGTEKQETTKQINVYNGQALVRNSFIDAGAFGGATFRGPIVNNYDANQKPNVASFVLMGSNTEECVIAGDATPDTSEWQNPLFFIKRGTGTWRFADGALASGTGGLAIEEGTLRFDSIADIGTSCSLGLATALTSNYWGAVAQKLFVPYAHALGADGKDPTFEFVGSASSASHDRATVLKGAGGRLRSASANNSAVVMNGFSALGKGDRTLTLDGETKADGIGNVASGITDGEGTVHVVKEGAGEWTLAGEQTFHGALTVKGGTLCVRQDSPDGVYTWFRLTFKKTLGNSWLYLRAIGLFDDDGVRQNLFLNYKPWPDGFAGYPAAEGKVGPCYHDYLRMEPGSVCYGNSFLRKYQSDRELYTLFNEYGSTVSGSTNGATYSVELYDDVAGKDGNRLFMNSTNSPNRFVQIVMRLTNGTHEVTHYDFEHYYNYNSGRSYLPEYWDLEGSVDGITWDMLDEHHHLDTTLLEATPTQADCWLSNESKFASDGNTYAKRNTNTVNKAGKDWEWGWKIRGHRDGSDVKPPVLQNAASIAVLPGATLKLADGSQPVTLKRLAVDASATGGAGRIEGFALDASTTLFVTGAGVAADIELPLAFVNCTGLEDLGDWTVSVDGHVGGRFVELRDGKLHLLKKGLMLIVR